MGAEEDRQAMLEKIRADMQATRERLALARSRKATVVAEAPSTATESTTSTATASRPTTSDTQSKLSSASSLIDKMKAEREAKRAAAAKVETPVQTTTAPKEPTTPAETPAVALVETKDATPAATNSAAPPRPKLGTGKNIRSLADLQKAIKKADRVKKHAESQGKIGDLRRQQGETRKKQMTAEERRAYRQSKRLTVEMQHSQDRVKVNTQISKFMKMIQVLEKEWQKGEEDRVKREAEMEEQRLLFEKASAQMGFLSNALSEISAQMEAMNKDIDSMTDVVPKNVKKEDKWYGSQFLNFKENFIDMRHQAYINSAKHKKMMDKTQKEAEDLAKEMKAPPPPLPSLSDASGFSANPITNLLAQIRSGTELKKLNSNEVEEDRKKRQGNWRQSVQLLEGLQATLCDALDQRHLALFSDSDEEDDEFDDDWDD